MASGIREVESDGGGRKEKIFIVKPRLPREKPCANASKRRGEQPLLIINLPVDKAAAL